MMYQVDFVSPYVYLAYKIYIDIMPSRNSAIISLKFDEVFQMVESGRIESGIPIIAIQWLYINREKLREKWSVN